MSIAIKIGGDNLDLADELMEEFHAGAKQAVAAARDIVYARTLELLRRHGTNAPAPPRQPPATVSGDLIRLTKKMVPRVRGATASAGIRYAPHAHLVDLGHVAVDGTRVLPRPFIRTAFADTEAQVDALLRERLG